MEYITELIQQIDLNTFEVENSYWVDVTHINDPHDFYIRPRAYNVHMPIIQAPGKSIKETEFQPGLNVVFKSMISGSHIRGQVRYIEQNDDGYIFDVFAPDYGFIEKDVLKSNIFKPYVNFPVPPLATKCKLIHCKPIGPAFNDKVIDAMKYYIGKERAKMIVKIKLPDTLVVELLNSMPDDIATLLALTGYTCLGFNTNAASCFTNPIPKPKLLYYKLKDVKLGERMLVRALSGKKLSEFYVADINDHKKYVGSLSDFNNYCKYEPILKIEELTVGQTVAVKDPYGKYERGIIRKVTVPDTKAFVQLVDLGTLQEVHINFLRLLKSEYYFARNAAAIFCAVEDRQVSDHRFEKYLYPGFEFFISFEKLGNGFKEPHIVRILPKSTQ